MRIESISLDQVDLPELREEASSQGFRFVERLADDWARGTNRFEGPGEVLFGAFAGERLIGIGGLNREPYDPAPGLARLRHLFVLGAFRRRGVGRALVHRLLGHAGRTFDEVRLRTDDRNAALFYEKLGFEQARMTNATHRIDVSSNADKPGLLRVSTISLAGGPFREQVPDMNRQHPVVDPAALSRAVDAPYRNVSLSNVNDHEIRMSVMTAPFRWHRHPDSDETFYGVDGQLIIEFDDHQVVVGPGEFVTVPAGTRHRTLPAGPRSVNLTFERKDAETIFDD